MSEAKIRPITDEEARKIEQLPILANQIPYHFSGAVIEGLEIPCASCGAALTEMAIRGAFDLSADEKTAHLRGHGVCYSCKTITPFESKFRNNGTCLIKSETGWRRGVWTNRELSSAEKILNFFTGHNWKDRFIPPAIAFFIMVAWLAATRG